MMKFDTGRYYKNTKQHAVRLLEILLPVFISIYPLTAQQNCLYAQRKDSAVIAEKTPTDTTEKKYFRRAAGELMLAEITPWVIDEYIRNVDYTKISWHTVKYNINPAHWEWDGDGFTTNQFGHPYHGSFYFNAFRTNGYNFWQSSFSTCIGSYLWETFAENQPPAPNDFINTSFGGIVLGEMVFRLSNRMVNNRNSIRNRKTNEVLALLVNPINGLNRILDKKWGRPVKKAEADTTPLNIEFDMGARKFRANNINNNFGLFGRAKITYGSIFNNYKRPFGFISINVEAGMDDSSMVNIASIYGSLYGWKIKNSKRDKHMALLTANYDFIRNEAFFYSGQSIRLSLNSHIKPVSNVSLGTSISGGLVLLAAVPVEHDYKGRYYNYCVGTGFNGSISVGIADHFFCNINYRGGWLKTVNGNASYYFLHTVNAEFRYLLLNGISIAAEPGYYSLRGNYKDFNDTYKTYPFLKLWARYSLHTN